MQSIARNFGSKRLIRQTLESGNAVPLVGEVCALSHLALIRLTLILSVTNVLAKCGDASVLLPFGRALGTRVLLGAGQKRNLWV